MTIIPFNVGTQRGWRFLPHSGDRCNHYLLKLWIPMDSDGWGPPVFMWSDSGGPLSEQGTLEFFAAFEISKRYDTPPTNTQMEVGSFKE